ncbi:DUF3027 domain-containing protein [Nocardioides salsibiostraticola]
MRHDADVSTLLRNQADGPAAAATDQARAALVEEVDATAVGEYLDHVVDGPRVVTHHFACTLPGYVGWRWAVTVTRASRQKTVTICEIVLLPGDEAIVAPDWVPYRERVLPGDMSPGDLMPVGDDDPRLAATYSFGDDPLDTDDKTQVRLVAKELGLGRVRTLSPEGRDAAAERWYDGGAGPDAPIAEAASDQCTNCGFLVRLNGPLSELFGVCANGDANDDGRVVSYDHGCGAHSEVRLAKKYAPVPVPDHVWDTLTPSDVETF